MTIYYVDPVSGSDAAAGTSFGAAWLTTQKAADTAAAGDEVRQCATGTETPGARIDFDTNVGSVTAGIRFIAYNATGTAPLTTGHYTISGSSLPATTDLVLVADAIGYLSFDRIRFTAATRDNFTFGPSFNRPAAFRNCRFDTASGDGIYAPTTGGSIRLLQCEVDNNTAWGLSVNAAGRGPYQLVGGSVHDNGSGGIQCGETASYGIFGVQVYDNTGDGINADSTAVVVGCTIYGNSGDGLQIIGFDGGSTSEACIVANNSFSSNGGYGVNVTGTTDDANLALFDFNHYYNNTSGETTLAATPGANNQSGDPQFASVVDGSEDFTPADGSPLDGTGIGGLDIGAVGTADPVGGGGGGPLVSGRLVR